MTIKYHDNVRKMYINRAILQAGFNASSSISIYSGAQPPAADILANWANYSNNNSKFLIHYIGVIWTQPLNGHAYFCSISTFPAATLPKNSGTGNWAILWPSAVTDANTANVASIPNADFMVVPVSNLDSRGVVRFDLNTDFVVGTARVIADGVISSLYI